MASSGESLPRVAYVEGASSREMDVAAYVAYQNNGGRKPKAPASMKSAASAASLLSSTTVAALSSKDAVAPPMSPPASKSVEDGFGQPIENQNKRYSRKCMLWFALATVVACCIGAGLGVGLGLYLPRPAGADRANAATDISGGSAGNGVVTSTRSSFPSATSAATPSIVPGECSNYTFTNGALLSSSSTSSTSSRVLARLEPEDDGRPLLGFSIEWGVDYPTNLTSRLGGKPPAIIGGFAHLINDTYWEQNIIDWYAWQVAMGAFTNYNASNPGTGYAGADHPPPIMLLALMPGFDLAQLKESTVQGIAEQMARINREWGIPIMLRFGHEMNGSGFQSLPIFGLPLLISDVFSFRLELLLSTPSFLRCRLPPHRRRRPSADQPNRDGLGTQLWCRIPLQLAHYFYSTYLFCRMERNGYQQGRKTGRKG